MLFSQTELFLFGPTLSTGGSNQKHCMLSCFVNLYNNTESAIPPGRGFRFSFLLPLSCAARGLPPGLLTLVSSKTLGSLAYLEHPILSLTRDSVLHTSHAVDYRSIGLVVLTRNPEIRVSLFDQN
jgi:hypothetical protein